MKFPRVVLLCGVILLWNGFANALHVPAASAPGDAELDLDDMEYDRDNEGDSYVPPLVVVRNAAGEIVPMVQVPKKGGEFEAMPRMSVQECKNNASYFQAAKYVQFYLYRGNASDPRYEFHFNGLSSIAEAGFRRNLPTTILIHGWLGSSESEVIDPLAKLLLEQEEKNVIAVDWEKGASTILYPVARYRVPKVADVVAALIDNLVEGFGQDIGRLGIIGHSLGAHIAGIAAKRVRSGKVGYIVGLDPASPLFRLKKPDERLSTDDAQYVEVIHTNGKALGFFRNIGQADFYPNGGVKQPGCGFSLTCSHQRAVDFYKESLRVPNYYANRCNDLENLGPECSAGRTAIGGMIWRSSKPSGVYYIATASDAPFLRSRASIRPVAQWWPITITLLLLLLAIEWHKIH